MTIKPAYQVFSRQSHPNGNGPSSHPRRVCQVATIGEARDVCKARNDKRSKREVRDGFHYEFAALDWYGEAFG